MKKIIQKENEVLRKISKSVLIDEITSSKIQKIIIDMKKTLESQEDGVAIAAPQINVPLRIFVVSHRAFDIHGEILNEDESSLKEDNSSTTKTQEEDLVFINPEIIKLSKKTKWLEEGCLSVRWLYGNVRRSTNATIRAYNEKGEQFTRGAGGLLAQIFQHEVDHLNGMLFIDKAKDIEEILPEKS